MKWTVGTKIGTGFAAVSAIFILIGVISYHSLNKVTDTTDWVTHTHKVLENLAGVLQGLTDAETGERGYIITTQDDYLEPYRMGVKAIELHIGEIRDLVKDNPDQERRLDAVESEAKQRQSEWSSVLESQKSKGIETSRTMILNGQGKQQMDDLRKKIAEMEDVERGLLNDRTLEAQATADTARWVIAIGSASAVVLSSLIGFFIAQSISKPLREITSIAERVAMGDLSTDVTATQRSDEVGMLVRTVGHMIISLRGMADIANKIAVGDLTMKVKPQSNKDVLGNAFSAMMENLRSMTFQITEGINTLSSSTNQISTTTTQLASSAAQTATAVTETTTTVEEVRQTSQVSSQKSKYVSESTQKASQTSQAGRKSVEATMEEIQRVRKQMESIADGMVRLSEQSKTVGGIITTVDDLSAQSNILAVNAAIEAAKAGEHGKGFAVVAQEVRSLAEQSKQATGQVRTILNDIQKATNAAVMMTEQGTKAVEVGVKQSSEAGLSIQTLAGSMAEAAQAATQIAASSQQQMVGMDQVASAMESIKQASAQNVASAKQLELAAHNLKELGHKLKQSVDRYKL